jgi:hypothetical protein
MPTPYRFSAHEEVCEPFEGSEQGRHAFQQDSRFRYLRSPHRVDSLNIYLDESSETILVKVEDEIMNKVEPIADNDEGKLVREFRLFKEVLDFLRLIEVTLSTNAFDFPNLTSASGGLDILKMNLRILAEVDNRPEVIVEACSAL